MHVCIVILVHFLIIYSSLTSCNKIVWMIYADYFNLICITYISYCNIAVTVQIHTHTYTYCIYFFFLSASNYVKSCFTSIHKNLEQYQIFIFPFVFNIIHLYITASVGMLKLFNDIILIHYFMVVVVIHHGSEKYRSKENANMRTYLCYTPP